MKLGCIFVTRNYQNIRYKVAKIRINQMFFAVIYLIMSSTYLKCYLITEYFRF